jgi:hypothetical protein
MRGLRAELRQLDDEENRMVTFDANYNTMKMAGKFQKNLKIISFWGPGSGWLENSKKFFFNLKNLQK